ncbi:hypothetical protein CCP3SC5AM1_2700002 [Gammaproteobacteria bacterium]
MHRLILPAYFASLILTISASIIIVSPNEYNQVFNQLIYADVFTSNIGYWMQNSYFSKDEFNFLYCIFGI